MSLRSQVSGRLAQLRAAGQLLRVPRPWPGPSAGATRTRSSARGPPASLGAYSPGARPPAGVGAWGAAAVGRRRAGVRTWAPLAMAAKVDLSTSTDWKEAKSFLKGLSDKQREEHYFCRDFVRLKKIPTWKETAKGVTAKVEEPKYKKDKQLNEKISLFRGDITKLEVDAIVNAASQTAPPALVAPSQGTAVGPRAGLLSLSLLVCVMGRRGRQDPPPGVVTGVKSGSPGGFSQPQFPPVRPVEDQRKVNECLARCRGRGEPLLSFLVAIDLTPPPDGSPER
ncbi:LOW QUALITY PROTEIN: ADP-ribose glycohydrolase MACROD1, partial [Hyaena hyaena]|uniref:LOW QUALITY PROTEIN: ADP-ribose glycohydrolase MACROD1 n=1 Tax=Hyaena hyaena TaxID=95912 RepID=UPI001924950A